MRSETLLAAGVMVFAAVVLGLAGCGTQVATDPAFTAGEAKFTADCKNCHTAVSLRGTANSVTNDLGSLSPAMTGITLTDEEVANLKVYLAAI